MSRARRRARARLPAAAILCAALMTPRLGPAHPMDGGVMVAVMHVAPSETAPDARELKVFLLNDGAWAATLRGFSAEGYRVTLERKRSFLGFETWQGVDFLRIEPGVALLLEPPDYRVVAAPEQDAPPKGADQWLRADFGPLGVISIIDPFDERVFPAPGQAQSGSKIQTIP